MKIETTGTPRGEWDVGYLYHAPCGVKGEIYQADEKASYYRCPKCGAEFTWGDDSDDEHQERA